jgi:hypothetical protein
MACGAALALGLGQPPGRADQTLSLGSTALASLWDAEHVSSPLPPLVDHAEVRRRLAGLAAAGDDGLVRVRELGTSVEGRPIAMVSFGRGPFAVLAWSQMHGDEATATSALFDLYAFIQRHRADAAVKGILDALTVHTIPMLNPDGAERWQRRNAQQIDINRDALLAESPEGQILRRVRDELAPRVGLNLHNQGWNTTAGDPPRPAAISLLSVAFDEARTVNDGRLLTKRLAAVVRDALEPLMPGVAIGRYDDSFEVRAFGDNLTKWGTPVLLIETGPWPSPDADAALVRLNFVALVRALAALSDGSIARADPARYDSLPENGSQGFYYVIRQATILVGKGVPAFVGDVGIGGVRRVRLVDGVRRVMLSLSVSDVGDLRTYAGLFEIDGRGKTVAASLPGLEAGALVTAEALAAGAGAIQTASPADLMVLVPVDGGFRVERVIRPQEEIR